MRMALRKLSPHTEQRKSTEDIIPEYSPPVQSQQQPALTEKEEEIEGKPETNDSLALKDCQSKAAAEADGDNEKLPITTNVMENHKEITSEEDDTFF